jgi:Raf kinase inhibitor-like YbhB/YbcL family protein
MAGGGGGGDMAMMMGGSLTVSSSGWAAGGTIPMKYAHTFCSGANTSVPVSWSGAPAGTQSFAVLFGDPDAALGGEPFLHWGAYGLMGSRTMLAEGASASKPADLKELQNDYGEAGYGGPCPPPGETHNYNLTVYALDTAIGSASGQTDLKSKMNGHILAQGSYAGKFGN